MSKWAETCYWVNLELKHVFRQQAEKNLKVARN